MLHTPQEGASPFALPGGAYRSEAAAKQGVGEAGFELRPNLIFLNCQLAERLGLDMSRFFCQDDRCCWPKIGSKHCNVPGSDLGIRPLFLSISLPSQLCVYNT